MKLCFLPIYIFIIFLLTYCTPFARKDKSSVPKMISVVFVPGYKGSELFRKDKAVNDSSKKVWLTAFQSLNFSSPDLTLKNEDGIIPGKVLERVRLIPYLIDVKIYSPWLNFMSDKEGILLYTFPYDWRKDNSESAELLEDFLQTVKKDNDGRPPVVIGHSNGGLLTLSVLNRRKDLFAKAVFVGTPFRGGIGFMEDLIPGIPIAFNETITAPCIVQSFESVFTFFSRNEKWDTKDTLHAFNGEIGKLSYFRAEDWKKFQLGVYSSNSKCTDYKIDRFQSQLDRAFVFRKSLDPVLSKNAPPVYVIHANNRSTIRTLFGNKTDAGNWNWDFKNAKYAPGDGRVTFESSVPPPGIDYESFLTTGEHSSILNEEAVQTHILDLIRK